MRDTEMHSEAERMRTIFAPLSAILSAVMLLFGCSVAQGQMPEDSAVVRVLYFHPTIRCQTCLTIEAFAETSLRAAFGPELARGEIEWRVIDYEREGDTASVRRFGIENQALVISLQRSGRELRWRRLSKAWKLVDDYREFQRYLVVNVRAMMRKRWEAP